MNNNPHIIEDYLFRLIILHEESKDFRAMVKAEIKLLSILPRAVANGVKSPTLTEYYPQLEMIDAFWKASVKALEDEEFELPNTEAWLSNDTIYFHLLNEIGATIYAIRYVPEQFELNVRQYHYHE